MIFIGAKRSYKDHALSHKAQYSILILILLSGIFLSFILYSGPFYAYDDDNYIIYAHQMMNGTFSFVQSPYAYGYLLPATVFLSFNILGISTFAALLPSLIEYLLIVVLIFLIGRLVINAYFGLLCAFIAVTSAYMVGYSTRVLPDMLIGLLATAALYLFFKAKGSKNWKTLYFSCGALSALTIFVKSIGALFVVALFLVTLVAAIDDKSKQKSTARAPALININGFAYLVLGIVVLASVYFFSSYIATGNPFYTILSYGAYQSTISNGITVVYNVFSLATLLAPANTPAGLVGQATNPEVELFGIVFLLALIGTGISVVEKDAKVSFFSAILWIFTFYMFFGSLQLTQYSPIYVLARYFDDVAAPLSLLASYTIYKTYEKSKPVVGKNIALLIFSIFIFLVIFYNLDAYYQIYLYNLIAARDSAALGNIISYLNTAATTSTGVVFVSQPRSISYMSFLSAYHDKYNLTAMQGVCTQQDNGSLLLAFYYSNMDPTGKAAIIGIDNWTDNCTITPVKTFVVQEDNSSYVDFWGYPINATLYSVRRSAV